MPSILSAIVHPSPDCQHPNTTRQGIRLAITRSHVGRCVTTNHVTVLPIRMIVAKAKHTFAIANSGGVMLKTPTPNPTRIGIAIHAAVQPVSVLHKTPDEPAD